MTRFLLTFLALAGTASQVLASGESISIPIGDLPPGKTVEITYSATVDRSLPAGPSTVSSQGTVSYNEGPGVLTDDPNVAGPDNPTDTDAFSTGQSIPVANFSFESPALPPNGSTLEKPGWEEERVSGGVIQHIPGFSGEGNQHFAASEEQIIINQVLPRSCFKANTVYTLSVAVGNLIGQTEPGNISAYALGASGAEVGLYAVSADIDASTMIAPGTFVEGPPAVLDTTFFPDLVGQPIQVCLGAFGTGPSFFDNVRITEESPGVLADEPVAYYRFDEAPGSAQATDSSGNGNHATYANGATTTAEGVPIADQRSAAIFDGDDDYIATPALGAALPAFTFEGWFKVDAPVAAGCCVSFYSPDIYSVGTPHFNIRPNYFFDINLRGANNPPSIVLPPAEWIHVAVVYDSTANFIEYFVNGLSVLGKLANSGSPPLANLGPGQIGGWAGGSDRNFTGLMDDVAIFDKALTADQIKSHYETAIASGPHFGEGTWAVREIYGSSLPADSFTNASLIANDPFGKGGTVLDYQSASINRLDTGPPGLFSDDVPFVLDDQTPQGTIDGDDNLFVLEAKTLLRITEEDDYTFGFSSDEGAQLRVIGAEFISSTPLNPSNPAVPAHSGDALNFPGNTGNSDTLGVAHLTPGVYELRFLTWEADNGAYAEVFVARGALTAMDGSFRLIGDPIGTPPAESRLPEISAPGFAVTTIYDGANSLNAAIDDLYGHWSGDAPGSAVFTEDAPTINYVDPDAAGGGGKGRPQTAFPGETPSIDDQNFALGARAQMAVPEAGIYTFLTLGDDSSQVRIKGTRGWAASGIAAPLENGYRINGCCIDGLGQVFLEAGTYTIELIWFEAGGGAHVSLFAAKGFHDAFNSEFELLGTPANTFLPATLLPITGPRPPANNFFVKAFDLGSPPAFSVSGHNEGATTEDGDPIQNPIWFSWTAPSAALVTLDTSGSSFGANFDVFTGSRFADLTDVARNGNPQNPLIFNSNPGETYRIRVFGGANSGLVQLNLGPEVIPPVPAIPANDDFANATNLGSESWAYASGDNTSATTEVGEPALGAGSVWYTWTAPRTGFVTLGSGISPDTDIGVFSGGSVGSLVEVGMIGGQGEFFAEGGMVYRIAVAAPGEFTLSLATVPEILASDVDFSAGALALTWDSEPRQTYRIEVGTDLETFPFVLECEASEGTMTSAVFEGLPGLRYFYRVARE